MTKSCQVSPNEGKYGKTLPPSFGSGSSNVEDEETDQQFQSRRDSIFRNILDMTPRRNWLSALDNTGNNNTETIQLDNCSSAASIM